MNKKKSLGQFFTTNVNYILSGFEDLIKNKDVFDPFAGTGELLNWALNNGAKSISGLDIDSKLLNHQVKYNDSLIKIPKSQFNLTNPPYLAKNKMSKEQKNKYICSDLYLLAVQKIIDSETQEGILIIPVNFFSAENSTKIRNQFLNKYSITRINYFKEQVFNDTTYNVVAFHYLLGGANQQVLNFTIFPERQICSIPVDQKYSYQLAGKELADLTPAKVKIIRLTEGWIKQYAGDQIITGFFNDKQQISKFSVSSSAYKLIKNNIILLCAIDTNSSESGWIKVEDIRKLGVNCLVGKESSRNLAFFLMEDISLAEQEKMIEEFNLRLNKMRKKYCSLFLTNFRDGNRKRIGFDLAAKMLGDCLRKIRVK